MIGSLRFTFSYHRNMQDCPNYARIRVPPSFPRMIFWFSHDSRVTCFAHVMQVCGVKIPTQMVQNTQCVSKVPELLSQELYCQCHLCNNCHIIFVEPYSIRPVSFIEFPLVVVLPESKKWQYNAWNVVESLSGSSAVTNNS